MITELCSVTNIHYGKPDRKENWSGFTSPAKWNVKEEIRHELQLDGPIDEEQQRLLQLARTVSELEADDIAMWPAEDLQLLMASSWGILALLEGEELVLEEGLPSKKDDDRETSLGNDSMHKWKMIVVGNAAPKSEHVVKHGVIDIHRYRKENPYHTMNRKQMVSIDERSRRALAPKKKHHTAEFLEDETFLKEMKMGKEEMENKILDDEEFELERRYAHRRLEDTFSVKCPLRWE